MLLHTQLKHDITCWTVAIGLHLLLFLMNFDLRTTGEETERFVPVVEIEYVAPEEMVSTKPAEGPGEPVRTFTQKLKEFFRIKEVTPAKKEEIMAGTGPSKLEGNRIAGLSQRETLIDRKGSLSGKANLSPIDGSKERLIHRPKEEEILLAAKESTMTDVKLQNLKDKDYKVAKKDLPFEVATREDIRGNGMEIVGIDLGSKTSKDILTQAPTLKDIKQQADFREGVFRVVKQEARGKLSGAEVLANLLALAKKEDGKRLEGYGSELGSGGVLVGKEGYGGGIGGAAVRFGEGSGGGSGGGSEGGWVGLVRGAGAGERIGTGLGGDGDSSTGGTGGSSTEGTSKGTSKKEIGESKEKEKQSVFKKGVVFARAPKAERGLAGPESEDSGSGSEESGGVTRRAPKGRVIFEIMGPLSKRAISHKIIPSYPEWAEKEGIEAGVSVHFVVLSNGEVKENIYVVTTSGYPTIDKLVMDALRQWRFAPLKGDAYGREEWGVLNFYFSLKGGAG